MKMNTITILGLKIKFAVPDYDLIIGSFLVTAGIFLIAYFAFGAKPKESVVASAAKTTSSPKKSARSVAPSSSPKAKEG